ncbi:MAG: hypothetical protein NVSMB65_16410 [Chloroflexota bacterium]
MAALTVAAAWLGTLPDAHGEVAAVGILTGSALLAVAMARPLWLFPLMALLANLIVSLPLAGANPIPADLCVAGLLVGWCGSRARPAWTAAARRLVVPFLLLVGLSALSLVYSANLAFGMVKVAQLGEFLLLFLLTVAMLPDPRWMRRTLLAYVAASTVLALAVIAYTGATGIHSGGTSLVFYQKNGIGRFLVMALLMVSAVLVYAAPAGWRRAWWIAVWAVLLCGEVLTGSRGAWSACVIGFAALALPRGKAMTLRLAVVVGIVLLLANATLPQSLVRTDELHLSALLGGHPSDGVGGSALVRLVVWRDALGLIGAHPLLGVGAGGYLTIDAYQGDTLNFNATDPHNMILYEWAEVGAVGLCIFLWLLGAIVRAAWQALHRARDRERRWLAAAALSSLTAYLVTGLTEPIWTRGDGLIFFLLVGMTANLGRRDGETILDVTATPVSSWGRRRTTFPLSYPLIPGVLDAPPVPGGSAPPAENGEFT